MNTSNPQANRSSIIMGSLDQKEILATRSVGFVGQLRLAQRRMMYDDDGGDHVNGGRGRDKSSVLSIAFLLNKSRALFVTMRHHPRYLSIKK